METEISTAHISHRAVRALLTSSDWTLNDNVPPASLVDVANERVESGTHFAYLGSNLDSSGYCTPELLRCIGIASMVFGRLDSVWKQSRLSLQTKLRICTSHVQSSLLHGADTWTILKADGKRLQAFRILCQHCILGIRWSDFVTNSAVTEKTRLPDICAVIDDRKLALFGHVRRLPEGTPAHDVLHASVESHAGMVPHPGWWRKPGRPRCTWLRDFLKATCLTAREAWTAADEWEEWHRWLRVLMMMMNDS